MVRDGSEAMLSSLLKSGLGLSFVAGFVDALGFVALFGLFTAHVTGNFIMIGVQLAQSSPGIIAKLLAIPVFILVIAGVRVLGEMAQKSGYQQSTLFLLLQIGLLLGFMALGFAWPPEHADGWREIVLGLTGVAAMSVQNAHSRLVLPPHLPTTVMTGTVTQLVIDTVDRLRGTVDPRASKERLLEMAPALLFFAGGAVTGAFGYVLLGFGALTMPILILGLLLPWKKPKQ
jgi:uncharacterized membrane protein YoaK (UPF0700 family)